MKIIKNSVKKMSHLQQIILNAGFREGTPIEKVKVLVSNGKWKPTTNKAIKATEELKQYFFAVNEPNEPSEVSENEEASCEASDLFEEDNKSEKVKEWGYYYGLEFYPSSSSEEKTYYKRERLRVEETLKKEFGMDVSSWGNPLTYDTYE